MPTVSVRGTGSPKGVIETNWAGAEQLEITKLITSNNTDEFNLKFLFFMQPLPHALLPVMQSLLVPITTL